MKAITFAAVLFIVISADVAVAGKKETKAERQARWAAERAVRVVSEAIQVEGCKLIGSVEGKGYRDMWTGEIKESQAFRGLQGATYRAGGDTALIVTFSPGDSRTGANAVYRGEAYLCKDREATPTPAPTPAPQSE